MYVAPDITAQETPVNSTARLASFCVGDGDDKALVPRTL